MTGVENENAKLFNYSAVNVPNVVTTGPSQHFSFIISKIRTTAFLC